MPSTLSSGEALPPVQVVQVDDSERAFSKPSQSPQTKTLRDFRKGTIQAADIGLVKLLELGFSPPLRLFLRKVRWEQHLEFRLKDFSGSKAALIEWSFLT